jgi:hypothetical protein
MQGRAAVKIELKMLFLAVAFRDNQPLWLVFGFWGQKPNQTDPDIHDDLVPTFLKAVDKVSGPRWFIR